MRIIGFIAKMLYRPRWAIILTSDINSVGVGPDGRGRYQNGSDGRSAVPSGV